MSEEEITKLADKISFRLMATKNHPEYEWLLDILKKLLQSK